MLCNTYASDDRQAGAALAGHGHFSVLLPLHNHSTTISNIRYLSCRLRACNNSKLLMFALEFHAVKIVEVHAVKTVVV